MVVFLVIFTVGMVWVFAVKPLVEGRSDKRRRSQSAAFRSRWQHVPLWQVPHDELAAEAKRCEAIIATLELQSRSGHVDPRTSPELTSQIVWYRSVLDAVQQAMAWISAAQGGWTAQGPRQ